ncbi:MAG TPA: DMT family transporter [Gammaproteobacteria bacterium]|nr:DMT family transporter [Gammaproteobacteria bacterium]
MSTSTRSAAAAPPMPRLALLAGCVTLLIWSGTPIANKIAVDYMSGFAAGVIRSTIAASLALVAALAFRLPFPRGARDRSLLALSGIASFAVWPVVFSVGIARTTAGHTALILATIPIFAVLLASALERRRPAPGWWVGASVAIGGAAFLVLDRSGSTAAVNRGASVAGDLIVLGGSFVCAVGYVAGGRLSPRIGTSVTTLWGLALALVLLAPVTLAAVIPKTHWAEITARGWLGMAWLALLSSLLAYALWFYALGRGGIGRVSSLLLVEPAITLAAAAAVLGEHVTLALALGCAVVVAGTYLAHRYGA